MHTGVSVMAGATSWPRTSSVKIRADTADCAAREFLLNSRHKRGRPSTIALRVRSSSTNHELSLNLHSVAFPGGEIRRQTNTIPRWRLPWRLAHWHPRPGKGSATGQGRAAVFELTHRSGRARDAEHRLRTDSVRRRVHFQSQGP